MSKITFIDSIGRTIVGTIVDEFDSSYSIKNPAMINVQQMQNGQLQVQLIPLFFAEFISEASRLDGTVWKFNKNNITVPLTLELDTKLVEQYDRIFNPQAAVPVNESVVKLFDE